jgi:hypothetical protein
MDCFPALERLEQAVRRIAETQALIVRQKALIEQLTRERQSVLVKRARLKLRYLEREQVEQTAERERLREQAGL